MRWESDNGLSAIEPQDSFQRINLSIKNQCQGNVEQLSQLFALGGWPESTANSCNNCSARGAGHRASGPNGRGLRDRVHGQRRP